MTKAQASRVIRATVRVDGKGGQGVLVTGGFILTATHCIKWDGDGGMAMEDRYIETITTKGGVQFRVGPVAADPVSDIAVLDSLDSGFYEKEWERWREETAAVPVANTTPRFRVPLSVRILAHTGKWIDASIVRYSRERYPGGCLCIEADDRIDGGTSGGPVVDSDGRLVGVVSHSDDGCDPRGKCVGMLPIARLALPRWCWLRIEDGSERKKAKKRGRAVG